MTKSESGGIGTENEGSLHAAVKLAIAEPGDRFEVRVGGYIVDILRGDHIIEIQTGNFTAIRKKIRTLIAAHPVTLAYPIPVSRRIVTVSEKDGSERSSRKSPKKGRPADLFRELIRLPDLMSERHFSIELLMIREEEVRCDDGRGSWRRKGVSIIDRRLLEIVERIPLSGPACFNRFIPEDIPVPFTNKMLAVHSGRSIYDTRKMTYCLRKMGALSESGKQGNEILMSSVFLSE